MKSDIVISRGMAYRLRALLVQLTEQQGQVDADGGVWYRVVVAAELPTNQSAIDLLNLDYQLDGEHE